MGSSLSGQTTANPFDLKHRQPIKETTVSTDSSNQSVISTSAVEKPVNPFDLAAKPIKKPTKASPKDKKQDLSLIHI